MIGVLIALVLAAGCALVGMAIGLTDEVRKRPGPFRRAGSGLAMVASFAGLWLLVTPVEITKTMQCGAPILLVSQWSGEAAALPLGCADVMLPYVVAGLIVSVAAPPLVLATRGPVS